MHDKMFYTPISITNDAGDGMQIATLSDAHRFLSARPEADRSDLYLTARKACEVAAAGYITMEQTRRAVAAYLEDLGVLEAEVDLHVAARAVARGYGGFAS